ncbi:MAG TPA: cytochrome c-type biogenesis protein CcmH [Gemmatimonadaceae bacterium]|nr:cytochrome c-type biogenesis protein CcmH [Gemmatimonadaceae bacterium]
MQRRAFLTRVVASAAGASASVSMISRVLGAQNPQAPQSPSTSGLDSSNLFAMDQSASRPVRRPPKPGARPVVSAAERDEIEHRIRCQCGCTLDVYTCRTTDFSCQVSPSMHRDVIALAAGGYTAQEIIDSFVSTYGERVLMAPPASGFNLLGWVAPFIALGGGAVLVLVVLRNWHRTPRTQPVVQQRSTRPEGATDDEIARLEAAIRDDE